MCHEGVADSRSAADTFRPDMDVCANCHDVEDDGTCNMCHTNVDEAGDYPVRAFGAAKFAHAPHVAAGLACGTCHGDPEGAARPIPGKPECRVCHATAADYADCRLCHADDNDLRPATHVTGWDVRHGADARLDQAACALCHTQSTCQECHAGDNVRPRTHPLNFAFDHAARARGNELECAVCHTEPEFCTACHAANRVLPASHSQVGWVRALRRRPPRRRRGLRDGELRRLPQRRSLGADLRRLPRRLSTMSRAHLVRLTAAAAALALAAVLAGCAERADDPQLDRPPRRLDAEGRRRLPRRLRRGPRPGQLRLLPRRPTTAAATACPVATPATTGPAAIRRAGSIPSPTAPRPRPTAPPRAPPATAPTTAAAGRAFPASSATTGPPAGTPRAGPMPAQHGAYVRDNTVSSVRPCHGADYQGGTSGVSCYQCHDGPGGHPEDWALPAPCTAPRPPRTAPSSAPPATAPTSAAAGAAYPATSAMTARADSHPDGWADPRPARRRRARRRRGLLRRLPRRRLPGRHQRHLLLPVPRRSGRPSGRLGPAERPRRRGGRRRRGPVRRLPRGRLPGRLGPGVVLPVPRRSHRPPSRRLGPGRSARCRGARRERRRLPAVPRHGLPGRHQRHLLLPVP